MDALVQKKDQFKANQAKQTEENKRKAEERIAKLTLDDNADSTEDGSEKTAEATACKYSSLPPVSIEGQEKPGFITDSLLTPLLLSYFHFRTS